MVASEISFEKMSKKSFSVYNVQNYSLELDENIEQELIGFYSKDVAELQKLTNITFGWSKKYIN